MSDNDSHVYKYQSNICFVNVFSQQAQQVSAFRPSGKTPRNFRRKRSFFVNCGFVTPAVLLKHFSLNMLRHGAHKSKTLLSLFLNEPERTLGNQNRLLLSGIHTRKVFRSVFLKSVFSLGFPKNRTKIKQNKIVEISKYQSRYSSANYLPIEVMGYQWERRK